MSTYTAVIHGKHDKVSKPNQDLISLKAIIGMRFSDAAIWECVTTYPAYESRLYGEPTHILVKQGVILATIYRYIETPLPFDVTEVV